MKYLRIFRAKKPIGQLSDSERREFTHNLASDILGNLVDANTQSLALGLMDASVESFMDTKEDFLKLCEIREILKSVESETLDKAFETLSMEYLQFLNSVRSITEKNLVEVSLRYLTLHWIDNAIHKRSLDVYSRLVEMRSALTKLDLWSGELEEVYRETSFGKSRVKPTTFVSCSVVIKHKDKNRLFDSTWNSDFGPAFSSDAYKESVELGSIKIWKAISSGMIPDLNLVFREFSSWVR